MEYGVLRSLHQRGEIVGGPVDASAGTGGIATDQDWTGRAVRQDKKGYIPTDAPRILNTLGLAEDEWRLLALENQKRSVTMLNGLETVAAAMRRKGTRKAA